ncbi:hypothetical protein HG619_19470 [Pseudomonas syringae]|nr:hypothetical protein [Pseudomonas syringae]
MVEGILQTVYAQTQDPYPHFEVFTDVVAAKRYAENRTLPLVLKVDGMAAGGIGVVIAHEWEEV